MGGFFLETLDRQIGPMLDESEMTESCQISFLKLVSDKLDVRCHGSSGSSTSLWQVHDIGSKFRPFFRALLCRISPPQASLGLVSGDACQTCQAKTRPVGQVWRVAGSVFEARVGPVRSS